VPVFLPDYLPSVSTIGLAQTSFQTPKLYHAYVTLKALVYRDAKIGVSEYIDNRHVLDVGCGPTLRSDYREYNPEAAASVTGVDVSIPFVLAARRTHPEPKYSFAVASIDHIPFPDKTFDTTIASFVIHHVPGSAKDILTELQRITRHVIVIYDHIRSCNVLTGAIQRSYWKLCDGGCNYLTGDEWTMCLAGISVEKQLRTGAIFGHVVKFVLRL
jgi:SAM-dependent methyltransferase